MQLVDDRLLLSASDLINHLECAHLTSLDLGVARGALTLEEKRTDAADLVARKGDEFELAHVESLRAEGREVTEIVGEPGLEGLKRGAERTLEAMRGGAEVIYQAVLYDGERWRGYADFLERVGSPSALGDWSYEVADTKLARRVKPYFLLQLCFYSELLGSAQGLAPEWMHVVLGSRARESLRLSEFAAYYRRVKARFEQVLEAGGGETYPDPVEHCGLCRWEGVCDARRAADDHLSLVANMRRGQTVRLNEAGVATVAQLAAAVPAQRPARIGAHAFEALREQARLQVEQRTTGETSYELLAPEESRGFARLPAPSEGDLFFDMEGDPFFEDGLEYLFGVTWIEAGEPCFRAFWATNRAEEKRAFEDFIDFVKERLDRFPDLHVYHYAPYEPTALKRLMGLHATREEEIDHLLRNEVLVDLYAVVRQGLRISQPNYSIKSVEAFYMEARDTEVAEGGDSIIAFEEFLETGDRSLLEAIERYNDDDCRSTWLLRGWLLKRRAEAIERFGDIPWRPAPEPWQPDPEDAAVLDELRSALIAEAPEEPAERDGEEQARWLLGQLLDYHRREAKPEWWAYFERLDADEQQLVELDTEALGGLTDAGLEPRPLPPPARSTIYTLRFPPQEHKIGPGDYADPATKKGVDVVRVDDAAGIVKIRRATARADEALPRALIPGTPYDTRVQRAALRRLASDVLDRGLDAGGRYAALRAIVRRDAPRSAARPEGGAIQHGAFDLDEAKAFAAGLDESSLFVQGPPGSGKTFTGAHLICHLLSRGARVGVASSSHAAIHNLLDEVERFAGENPGWRGMKKHSGTPESHFRSAREEPLIDNSGDIDDFAGGAAWSLAPHGCSLAPSLTALWTTSSSTRPGSYRWLTPWRSERARGTWCSSAIPSSSLRSRRPCTRRAPAPRSSSTSWVSTRRSLPIAACSSTRPGACTPTCADSSPRRSMRAAWSRSPIALASAWMHAVSSRARGCVTCPSSMRATPASPPRRPVRSPDVWTGCSAPTTGRRTATFAPCAPTTSWSSLHTTLRCAACASTCLTVSESAPSTSSRAKKGRSRSSRWPPRAAPSCRGISSSCSAVIG